MQLKAYRVIKLNIRLTFLPLYGLFELEELDEGERMFVDGDTGLAARFSFVNSSECLQLLFEEDKAEAVAELILMLIDFEDVEL